jgi:hypothetical protein
MGQAQIHLLGSQQRAEQKQVIQKKHHAEGQGRLGLQAAALSCFLCQQEHFTVWGSRLSRSAGHWHESKAGGEITIEFGHQLQRGGWVVLL